MKGDPTMPNQEPMEKKSLFAKERRIDNTPAEALELGKEIEADLSAVENLKYFEATPEFQAFAEYRREPESEPKAKAREAAFARLNDIKKRVEKMNDNLEKIYTIWKEELEK